MGPVSDHPKALINDLGFDMTFVLGMPVYVLAVVMFAALRWRHIAPSISRIRPHHLTLAVTASLLCAFMANLLYVYLLRGNDSYWVSAITCISPLITLVVAMCVLDERVNVASAVGVVLITVGVAMLSLPK